MMRTVLALVALLATSAFAQQNNWTIDRVAGSAVMDEVSTLTFRVTNLATSRDPISSFTIGIPNGPYDIDGATAPPGWRASNIDRKDRTLTFRAIDACTTTSIGLLPGQSALFEARVVGVPLSADAAGQALQKSKTKVLDICNRNVTFRDYGGTHTWTLVGLSSRMTSSARALDTGDQVTVTLTITNTSSVTQSAITPTAPVLTGTATFVLVSGPTPASVNSLTQDSTASFSWVYRATGRGSVRFASSARNAAVTSPLASSPDLNVGAFPAALISTPSATVNNGVITLQVLPTNNGASPLTNVTPLPATVTPTGTATATLITGPTPSSVDALGSRSTTAFTTTWNIRGDPGDRITFQARARAVDALGATVTSDPLSSADVTLRELTVTPSPSSVLTGAGTTQITYRLANGSDLPITGVVLMTPDANLFRTPTVVALPTGWTWSPSSTPRGVRFDANTAARILPGQTQTLTISYASIGTVTVNTPTSHKAHIIFSDTTTARAECQVTVVVNRPVPDISMPVAVATTGRVHFTWSNPALHDGVLILRSAGAPPNTAPAPGRRYPPGTALGNATVVYEDALSFNSSFADTGLTNGTVYYYRLYNRDEYGLYSPGNVPTASPNNHLLVITPGTAASDPLWCSTMGLPALQQPFTDLGKAIYQSTNGSYFTGNFITTGAPVNGNEKWRPSLTRGVVQARPTAQKLNGATEPSIFVGDQLGYAYRLSGATGAVTWTGNGGVALGEVIQAQSVIAVRSFSSAAFQAKYPTDVVFFSTRNSTVRSSNSVRALRADTGAQLFAYQPGNLDQITGAPMFDFLAGTLWVASLSTAGPSLRVIDVVNPTAAPLLLVSDLGDIPTGVTRQGGTNQALVVDRNGNARGYGINTRTLAWQINVGGLVTSPLVAYQDDFFASTATGVQRFHINTATNVVTPVWAAPAAMRLPTSVRVDAVAGKLFVGDADGFLRRLNLDTGVIERSVRVSTVGGVSMPSLDTTAGLKRVYVGTADGRLCGFTTTF
ncbi:MAG: hypothetical protein Q8N23_01960 [Archangium sp.]|nr:hypothetical protein [Archangium sp.]MDP3151405.1 hypothetical protein [Archangium sp.]MDP3575297.1 hypothetical protein [Archangium sp.]